MKDELRTKPSRGQPATWPARRQLDRAAMNNALGELPCYHHPPGALDREPVLRYDRLANSIVGAFEGSGALQIWLICPLFRGYGTAL